LREKENIPQGDIESAEEESPMDERRLDHRYELPLPAVIKSVAQGGLLQAKIHDISTYGVYFTTDQPLTVGLNFDLSLTLPKNVTHGSEVVVDARATVVRVDNIEDETEEKRFGIAASIRKYNVSPVAVGFALHKADQARCKVPHLAD